MTNTLRLTTLILIILASAATRFFPILFGWPFNFTPILAIALFGGAHFSKKIHAYIIPLAAMLLSDIVMYTFVYPGSSISITNTLVIYGIFILISTIGVWLQKRRAFLYVAGAAVLSPLLFNLIADFSVWATGGGHSTPPAYPMTLEGLIQCYTTGLPFLKNMLISTVGFTAVLFGGFALLERGVPSLRETALAQN